MPKYVVVELQYGGWVGLDAVALEAKSAPYKAAVLRGYNRMVVGDGIPDVSSTGRIFEKKRWCGVLSNLAQDRAMEGTVNLTHTVMALTVIAFVEATCARAGAFATDRFGRRGLNLYWKDKVVLKLTDFKIAREGMEVTYGRVVEYDSKRAQVDFNKIKRHYYEKYNYGQSMTPGDAEVVRKKRTTTQYAALASGRRLRVLRPALRLVGHEGRGLRSILRLLPQRRPRRRRAARRSPTIWR